MTRTHGWALCLWPGKFGAFRDARRVVPGLTVFLALAVLFLAMPAWGQTPPPPPEATITAVPTCGVAPLNVCFSATSGDLNPEALPWVYTWDFGDGTYPTPNVNDPLPCHAFMTANTTYLVSVTIQDQEGTVAPGATLISTNPLTVSACADHVSGGAPLLVQFNDGCGYNLFGGVPPYAIEWDFGDGSAKCFDWQTQHAFADPGTYYVSVKVTDACDPPSVVVDSHLVITVTQLAVVGTATADRLCGPVNTTVCFNGTSKGGVGPYTYTWDFGDGSPVVSGQSPCHVYDAAGTYTVTMTSRDSLGSTDVDDHLQVVITPTLSVTASASRMTGFAPFTVYFTSSVTGGTGPYTYLWDFGDGETSDVGNPSHIYATSGTYEVTLTVTDSCIPSSTAVDDHITLGVYPIVVTPTVNLSCGYAPLNVIFGATASGGVPPYTYAWSFGDGTPGDTIPNPSHSYLAVGNYTATVTVTDAQANTGVGTVVVKVVPELQVSVAGAPAVTGPAPLTVNVSSSVSGGLPPYTYDWDFADGSDHSVADHDQHTWSTAAIYDVVLTVGDACGHSVSKTLTVNSYGPVVPVITSSTSCGTAPVNVCFEAGAAGGVPPYTYSWNFGDGSPASSELKPCHNYVSAGTYHVTLTATDSVGNVGVSPVTDIHVISPQGLSVVAGASATQGLPPLLVSFTSAVSGIPGPYTYSWDFGDGSAVAESASPQHIYTGSGSFVVTLTVTAVDACGQMHTAVDTHLVIELVEVPSIRLTSPVDGATYGSTVNFQSSVFDDVGVVRVDYYVNGSYAGSGVAAPYTLVFDAAGINGSYSVYARVVDALGRTADSQTVTFTVSNPILNGNVTKQGSPFRLKVFGNYFLPGAVIRINGVAVPLTVFKSPTMLVAKGGANLKAMVPNGVPIVVTVQNPGGGLSNGATFTR